MTTLNQNLQALLGKERTIYFDPQRFIQENITRSVWLTLWLLVLTAITVRVTVGQLSAAPVVTTILLVVWLASVAFTAFSEITRNHSTYTLWLKNNLYSSITNAQLTLILTLLIIAGLRGFYDYSVTRAAFSTNPEVVETRFEELRSQGIEPGANWGAVADNARNLLVFRFPRSEDWRIYATLILLVALGVPSSVYYRDRYRKSPIRRILTILWLLSPIVIFLLLRGLGEGGPIPRINPEQAWGGFLLTMVISVFAILVSFPIGLLLALGRRSTIQGIPAFVTYPAALIIAVLGLVYSTPDLVASARSNVELALAYWPLVVPVIAWLVQRNFKGNIVALFSTIYIECWRGIPFITVLFMSIILFPIFLPPEWNILGTWRVLVAAAIFASAYLAENVRGGLQSIPNGQYEAADALGLSTYQKYRLIILPQALTAVIPAIVGQFIGLFKDTTLVAIVGLTDLLGAANLISAQPDWLGVRREPYIVIALVYFVGSAIMAGYSRRLEARLSAGSR
jgi:general L-amino acid transport system permease protein